MGNQLTDAQRDSDECPDCGHDPVQPTDHRSTCRRLGMDVSTEDGGGATPEVAALELQCGPPWRDWPDGVKPVNPRAIAKGNE